MPDIQRLFQFIPLHTPTDYLVWGIVMHFIADWIFQSKWMADNKSDLSTGAGWVHGAIHFLFLQLFVFPYWWALVIALLHIVVDTRIPLQLWRRFYRQTRDPNDPASLHVAIWGDQVVHIIIIAAISLLMTIK